MQPHKGGMPCNYYLAVGSTSVSNLHFLVKCTFKSIMFRDLIETGHALGASHNWQMFSHKKGDSALNSHFWHASFLLKVSSSTFLHGFTCNCVIQIFHKIAHKWMCVQLYNKQLTLCTLIIAIVCQLRQQLPNVGHFTKLVATVTLLWKYFFIVYHCHHETFGVSAHSVEKQSPCPKKKEEKMKRNTSLNPCNAENQQFYTDNACWWCHIAQGMTGTWFGWISSFDWRVKIGHFPK